MDSVRLTVKCRFSMIVKLRSFGILDAISLCYHCIVYCIVVNDL